jgi:lipid-A-disaccharide synthase
MPIYSRTVELLRQRDPEIEFMVIKAPGISEALLWRFCAPGLGLHFLEPDRRYYHMRECTLLIATSGTVTLESSLLEIPTIVAYQGSRLSFLVAVRLIKVPAISLTNLILKGNILPEFIQHQASPENLADQAWVWLNNEQELQRIRHRLTELPSLLKVSSAAERAARIILRDLGHTNI